MCKDPAGQEVTDTGTAGAIARPPFLFLVALLLGFVTDHLLPMPFPVPRIGLVHWISAVIAGSLILIGIAIFAAASAISPARRPRFRGPSPLERW
jgi:hypothetical protein